MNGIIIHYEEYGAQLDMLDTKQKGMLLESMISVAKGEDPAPEMDALTQMCFAFMKDRMIRDQELSEKRANARRKDPSCSREKQTKTKNNKTEQTESKTNSNTNTNTDTNTKEKDICASDSDPDPAEELFQKLWEMYPNKKGLGSISKSQKQKLLDIGEAQMIRALNRYLEERRQKELRGDFCPPWQNGSTWFNSGFADYLDQTYQPAPPDPKPVKTPANGFNNFQGSTEDVNEIAYEIMSMDEMKGLGSG